MQYYLQGLTLGLAYVAPIGLQNLFVIHAAATNGRRKALLTALIVTFFDVSLALACFFGAGAVLARWEWLQKVVLLAGGILVIVIGVGLLRAKAAELSATGESLPLGKTITSACVVTWCNPQALLDGTMMLGAFRVTLPGSGSTPFILGVASASCLWFSGLTLLISLFSDRIGSKFLRGINIVSGTVISLYGVKLLWNFFQMLL